MGSSESKSSSRTSEGQGAERDWRSWVDIKHINCHKVREITMMIKQAGDTHSQDLACIMISGKLSKDCESFPFLVYLQRESNFHAAFKDMKGLKDFSIELGLSAGRDRLPVNLTEVVSSLHKGLESLQLTAAVNNIMLGQNVYNIPSSLKKFNSLKTLTLKMFKLDTNAMRDISSRKSLVRLRMSTCTFDPETVFSLNLPKLEQLALSSMDNISAFLTSILLCSVNVKELHLTRCRNVSVEALRSVSKLKSLKTLLVKGVGTVDEEFIANLATSKCAKTLNHLDISHCPRISSGGLGHLASFKNITMLDIQSLPNLNDDAVIGIANNCHKLRYLCLAQCDNVSEAALESLSRLKSLDSLGIVATENVKDSTFMKMPNLKILECHHCPNLTDIGVTGLLRNASNLRELFVHGTSVTPETLLCATDVVEKRKRPDKSLEITINGDVVEQFNEMVGRRSSPFLKITPFYPKPRFTGLEAAIAEVFFNTTPTRK